MTKDFQGASLAPKYAVFVEQVGDVTGLLAFCTVFQWGKKKGFPAWCQHCY